MKKITWLVSTAIIFLSACASNSAEDTTPTVDESGTSAAPSTTTPDTSKSVWKDANAASPQAMPPVNQPATPGTNVALNPPHGQPNHRCDISVGAPLNSPVQSNQPAQPIFPSAAPLPAAGGQGTVKLNPAHGKPGHDCAVAVGAPLKG